MNFRGGVQTTLLGQNQVFLVKCFFDKIVQWGQIFYLLFCGLFCRISSLDIMKTFLDHMNIKVSGPIVLSCPKNICAANVSKIIILRDANQG
jgi:hypothetical protein